ncbi:kinase-like domain-containing protein, partial [Suillus ampliporus]
REVAVWIKLRHPHVLTLHGTVSGFGPLPALVSTWMDNGALHDYLERTPGLTMEQKLRLVRFVSSNTTPHSTDVIIQLKQVVDGLRYLHEDGIVHGDLTSTNVVIDRDGNAFLADFGLSLALAECYESDYNSYPDSANRWSAPELMGLPEPASIKDLDARDDDVDFPKPNWHSDIYSLGCIMLEVFSGKIPFWWLGKFQYIFTAQLEHAEPYRDDFSVSVEPQHLEFMRRCWSLRPEARPSAGDAASFVEDELVRLLSLPSFPKSFRAAELRISAIDQGDGDRNNDTNPASPPSPHSVPIQGDDDRGNDTHSTPPPAHSAPIQGDGDRGNYTNPMPPPIDHSAPIQGDGDRDNDTNPTSPPSAHPAPIPGDGYWDSEANPTPPSHSAPIHGDGFWGNDTSTTPPPSHSAPMQGDGFWGNDTNTTSPPSAHPAPIPGDGYWDSKANPTPPSIRLAGSSSPFRLRNLFGFLRLSTHPVPAPQPILMQPLRLRISRHSDRVAACQIEDVSRFSSSVFAPLDTVEINVQRIGIVHETDAEAAAAMQRTSQADSSTQPGRPAAGGQGSQGRPTEIQGSTGGTGEFSYEVSCCGCLFSCRPSPSRQS